MKEVNRKFISGQAGNMLIDCIYKIYSVVTPYPIIDDVSIAGFENVTVIHGKGTGALRAKIQNYLKGHHRVESFRLGNWDEGADGATIVTIKRD